MKILVLDTLIKQSSDSQQVSKEALGRIFDEYKTLASLEKQGKTAIDAYLSSQNGKKLNNSSIKNIFKYRLNAGDRILYTYGKYLPYIRDDDKDSMVLLGYAKHDDQSFFAQNKDFAKNHFYKELRKLVSTFEELKVNGDEEFTVEDLVEINNIFLGDYIKGHTLSVVSDEVLAFIELEDLDKYLSEEQRDCLDEFLEKPQPTMILGGAGTGKTLVALHALNNFRLNNPKGRAVYFTQSDELIQRAKTLYKGISNNDIIDEDVEFLNINDYCLSLLELTRSDYAGYKQFLRFAEKNRRLFESRSMKGKGPLAIWTEIRGTIKGTMNSPLGRSMGRQWSRIQPIGQAKFKNTAALIKEGYFERSNYDSKAIILSGDIKSIRSKLQSDQSLDDQQRLDVEYALKRLSGFDESIDMLSATEYASISDEASTIDASARAEVWDICRKYNAYLNKEGLFDDNDLARKTVGVIDDVSKFDCVIVDEIQDYSELQIYLLAKLSRDGIRIIFAGDEHQNINPALFSEKRVESMLGEMGNKLKTVYLSKNFRCQQFVVDVANSVAELRREKIGSRSIESEQKGESERRETKPYRLDYSPENLRAIASEISAHPGTAILVSDLDSRDWVIDVLGKDEYLKNDLNYVFAVSEIKGMEYKYAVCLNLIGNNINAWEEIMSGINTKHNTKYRYYFNLLYVGITRTQQHLCFMDTEIEKGLEERLALEHYSDFNADALYFSKLSSSLEDWIQAAKQYELNGNYESAIQNFRKGHAPKEDIYRCEMKLAEQDKEFDVAAEYAMLIGHYDEAYRYATEIKENEELGILAEILTGRRFYNTGIKDDYGTLNSIVDKCFMSFDEAEADAVKMKVTDALEPQLRQLADNISRMVGGRHV